MKIVILDGYTLNPGDLSWEPLKELGEVTVYERTAPKDVCKRAEGAEVVFTNKVVLDEAVLEKLPSLKYIGVLATGYNVVDVEAAARKGIVVTNIPAYSTSSVAQMAFAHILNIVQRVGYYAQEVSNGKWSRQADFSFWDAPLHELEGKRWVLSVLEIRDGLRHVSQSVLAWMCMLIPASRLWNFRLMCISVLQWMNCSVSVTS